ncbi:Uncharacterised protein [Candidatus Ornithobacterium hominis]|uniref:hypothetical protein n=1 Tax=Candidatus Ornithobacterium hominis TaxID=2497989 RepID=UPI000E5AD6A1|nr:hypothetical protein [Candidatus Ornithobacterium hominis]SZD73879.1 Uncharacterised protein [Candidatus Ornithobacterium hominis]
MNILNFFRKPLFSVLLPSLFLVYSCSRSEEEIKKNEFDLSIYNTYRANKIDFSKYKVTNKTKSSVTGRTFESFAYTVDMINQDFNTSLTFNQLDNELLDNNIVYGTPEYLAPIDVIDDYMTSTEINLCNTLENDLELFGFEVAMQNFQQNVNSLNVSEAEFQKYNTLLNTLYIMYSVNPEIFQADFTTTNKSSSTARLSPCKKAILWNAAATVSLAACGSGLFCAVAIVAKIGAMDSMIEACSGKSFL